MAVHRILQLGDLALRENSAPVKSASEVHHLLRDMSDTLHEFQRTHGIGRGISAIQIGKGSCVIYIEFEGGSYSMLNPEIEWLSEEKFRLWDDCFSFPDLMVRVERSETVRLRYIDENGAPRTVDASGPLSELIQHEMDHLDGVLAVDRVVGPDGFATREQWRRMRAAGSMAMGGSS